MDIFYSDRCPAFNFTVSLVTSSKCQAFMLFTSEEEEHFMLKKEQKWLAMEKGYLCVPLNRHILKKIFEN